MPSRYDQDTKAKTVRLFRDHAGDYVSPWVAMSAIAGRLGMSAEEAAREIRELKRKNRELEQTKPYRIPQARWQCLNISGTGQLSHMPDSRAPGPRPHDRHEKILHGAGH